MEIRRENVVKVWGRFNFFDFGVFCCYFELFFLVGFNGLVGIDLKGVIVWV